MGNRPISPKINDELYIQKITTNNYRSFVKKIYRRDKNFFIIVNGGETFTICGTKVHIQTSDYLADVLIDTNLKEEEILTYNKSEVLCDIEYV
jgi:hypothetical protein